MKYDNMKNEVFIMELLQIKYFCMVAQTENISQAARYFAIPQPAMSKTISNLEKELGVRLFERYGNKIHLNESGKNFLEKAQLALQSLQDGIVSVKDSPQTLSGEICLLVLEHRRLVTECIVKFKKEHPEVTFSIYHDFYEDENWKDDLRISALPPKSESLDYIPLLKEPILLAVPKQHRLACQKSVALSELANERFVSLPKANSIYQITTALCRKSGFEPHISILCDDPFYVRKYTAAGFGISFVPSISWQGLFEDNIVLLPVEEDGCFRTTSVYWNKDRYMTNATKAFKNLLSEHFKSASDKYIINK